MALPFFAAIIAGASGGGGFFNPVAGTYENIESLPDDSIVSISFNTDGSVTLGTSSAPSGASDGWWLPNVTGVGTGKYVRMVYGSGDDFNWIGSSASDTWYELSTARVFAIDTGEDASNSLTGDFTLQFSRDGSTVHASAAITMTATTAA